MVGFINISHIENAMTQAINKTKETMHKDLGGPLGSAIIDDTGKFISVSSNAV